MMILSLFIQYVGFFFSDLASFMLISLLYLPSKLFESIGVTECTQLEQCVLGFSELF